MPANTVYVGRPTVYGNPYKIDKITDPDGRLAIGCYRDHIKGMIGVDEIRSELRGKNLACFCPLDQPCHADVLLELANN